MNPDLEEVRPPSSNGIDPNYFGSGSNYNLDEHLLGFEATADDSSSLLSSFFGRLLNDNYLTDRGFQHISITDMHDGDGSRTETASRSPPGLGLDDSFVEAVDGRKNVPVSNLFKEIDPCSPHARTCMRLSQRIFEVLHTPSPTCLSSEAWRLNGSLSSTPRMTDSVLSNNQQVIRATFGILNCSCSSNFHIQLVLLIICAKLVAWYRALVHATSAGDHHSSTLVDTQTLISPPISSVITNGSYFTSHQNNTHMSLDDRSELVVNRPITMGGYVIDASLENKLRAQVILSEIPHLESLIKSVYNSLARMQVGNEKFQASLPRTADMSSSATFPTKSDYSTYGTTNNINSIPATYPGLGKALLGEASRKAAILEDFNAFLRRQLQSIQEDIVTVLKAQIN
ncbi:hypothetical protein DPV78_006496 [Talaromyces pinophilus]|jgi:hypothetical protein|nr:hypothetical protein DPV78_006496 [Talaromyces pinophilus]